jgi:hypothetical protein
MQDSEILAIEQELAREIEDFTLNKNELLSQIVDHASPRTFAKSLNERDSPLKLEESFVLDTTRNVLLSEPLPDVSVISRDSFDTIPTLKYLQERISKLEHDKFIQKDKINSLERELFDAKSKLVVEKQLRNANALSDPNSDQPIQSDIETSQLQDALANTRSKVKILEQELHDISLISKGLEDQLSATHHKYFDKSYDTASQTNDPILKSSSTSPTTTSKKDIAIGTPSLEKRDISTSFDISKIPSNTTHENSKLSDKSFLNDKDIETLKQHIDENKSVGWLDTPDLRSHRVLNLKNDVPKPIRKIEKRTIKIPVDKTTTTTNPVHERKILSANVPRPMGKLVPSSNTILTIIERHTRKEKTDSSHHCTHIPKSK